MTGEAVLRLVQSCSLLVDLDLSGCSDALSDATFFAIAEFLPLIRRLDASGSEGKARDFPTDHGVEALCRGCQELTDLNIDRNSELTIRSIKAIRFELKNLRRICFGEILRSTVDDSFSILVGAFRSIHSLDLSACRISGIPSTRTNSLQEVREVEEIVDCIDADHQYVCTYVQDSGLSRVTALCASSLTTMVFTNSITNGVVNKFVKSCGASLTALTFDHAAKLSDRELVTVAKHCRTLTELSLAGCEEVSDAGVIAVIRVNGGVTSLDLSGCELISDETIAAVVESCVSLRFLDVSDCAALTDEALRSLSQCKVQLTSLKVQSCANMTQSGVDLVLQNCAALNTIDCEDTQCDAEYLSMLDNKYCNGRW
eukprot:gene21871-27946_t